MQVGKRSPEQTPNYVELKTSRELYNERDEIVFERKLQKIWSQSFLLGVGRIICGFRDDQGILKSTKTFETNAIPAIARSSRRDLWDGRFSIDFTTSFLSWLMESVPCGDKNDGSSVWLIRYKPGSDRVELLSTNQSTFLTPSFMAWRSSGAVSEGGNPVD